MSDDAPLRIVIADDHGVVRAGLITLIRAESGMEVVGEAATADEAVRLAGDLRPDVVLVDISMPGGGVAATERIRLSWPDVRVIALTMHEDRAHLVRMLEAGAAGYVLKQSAPDELLRAVRSVARGESYVDPRLAGSVLRPGSTGSDEAADAPPLTEREEEVLRRIAWGESNKAIARSLEISARTVETYKSRISDKLGLHTRPEIVRYAVRRGWLRQPDA